MTKPAEAMLDPGTLVETLRHTGAGGLADRVESAIRSSPYLAGMVSDAMRMGRLTRITESRAWEPEAQYLRNDGTMSVNFHAHDVYRHPTLSMMVDYRMQKELAGKEEDSLVPTLAHEAYHSLTPGTFQEHRERLRLEFAQAVRQAGQQGTINITPLMQHFQEREFLNEATAEVHGWNALMSRIEHEHGGPVVAQVSRNLDVLLNDFQAHAQLPGGSTAHDQALFRERGASYADCVAPVDGPAPPLRAGVELDARGMVAPHMSRRWGECALDQRFYNNESFLPALATIASMRDATRFEGRLELDAGALGVDLQALLDRARQHDGWVRQPVLVHEREHGALMFGGEARGGAGMDVPSPYRARDGHSAHAPDADARAALQGQLEHSLRDALPADAKVAQPWINRFTGAAWDAGIRAGDPIDVIVAADGITLRGRHPTHLASVDLHATASGEAPTARQASRQPAAEPAHAAGAAPGLLQ